MRTLMGWQFLEFNLGRFIKGRFTVFSFTDFEFFPNFRHILFMIWRGIEGTAIIFQSNGNGIFSASSLRESHVPKGGDLEIASRNNRFNMELGMPLRSLSWCILKSGPVECDGLLATRRVAIGGTGSLIRMTSAHKLHNFVQPAFTAGELGFVLSIGN
ncbi:hypothetical protein Tco_0859886 [Tanacetum coccineum]|uniref:Uncharacterized protein n=1 Tax=Tanacetum coccineum TaxID=301880 RepID=A0ABQ5BF42_9ASTR